MELRHIRYFCAVAEELSFTKAAGRLLIAQSPLSQQIRQLEREVGVELFTRTTRSVALTYAGRVFYERVSRLLEASDAAIDAGRKAARGELGKLSVGFTGAATYELLSMIMRAYADQHPDVTFDVRGDMDTPQQVEALLDGRLAVGVLQPPVTSGGLAVQVLRREPVVVLLSTEHPAAVHGQLNLADLRDEAFISYDDDSPASMFLLMKAACASVGFVPNIRHIVSDSSALVALAAADMGIALVPASLRHLGIRGATYRPLSSPRLSTALAVAYRDRVVDPLVRGFVEIARTTVHGLQPAMLAHSTPTPATEDDRLAVHP